MPRQVTEKLNMVVRLRELFLKSNHLLLQFIDKLHLRVFVLHRFIRDKASFSCVGQGREVLFHVGIGRREACDHQAEGVAPDTLF